MRHIFFQLCIVCFALTTQAQETRTPQMTPVRTSDPAIRQRVKAPALPVKSGGGNAQQQAKVQQTTEVPLRKTDGAPAGSTSGGAQDNMAKGEKAAKNGKAAQTDKPAVVLPSSLSAREAKEQQSKQ